MQKYRFGPTICTIAIVLLTVACGQKGEPGATSSTGAGGIKPASPGAKPRISVASPRLVLPAVSGRPGAVYFTITNTGERPETIVGVAVQGAQQAQMHETSGGSMTMVKTLAIPAQGSAIFAAGGRHVMVFGLPAGLRAGATSKVTLSFADGERVSAPLTVLAPGGGGEDMAGMHMDH